MLEKLKGWRTVVINAALAFAALVLQILDVLQLYDWTQIMDPKQAALVVIAINILNIILRFVTSTPVGKREPISGGVE